MSIIKFLMTDLGVMAAMTQSLDPATCIAVAEGFGKVVGGEVDEEADEYVFWPTQPPRLTHVNHISTDLMRKTALSRWDMWPKTTRSLRCWPRGPQL